MVVCQVQRIGSGSALKVPISAATQISPAGFRSGNPTASTSHDFHCRVMGTVATTTAAGESIDQH